MVIKTNMSRLACNPFKPQAVNEAGGKEGDQGRKEDICQAGTVSAAAAEHGAQGFTHEPFGGADQADAAKESAQPHWQGIQARVHGSGTYGGHRYAEGTHLIGETLSETLQVSLCG